MVERDLQEDELYENHKESLDKKGRVEVRARVVEDPVRPASVNKSTLSISLSSHHTGEAGRASDPADGAHLNIDATSIIKGMSRENPALDFDRYMDKAWSL